MNLRLVKEDLWLLSNLSTEVPAQLAKWLHDRRPPEVLAIWGAFDTIAIQLHSPWHPGDWLQSVLPEFELALQPRNVCIPCCFDLGEDWDLIASKGIQRQELIQFLSSGALRCYAIGFQLGFPYLGFLPPNLATARRKDQVKREVLAGTVAIAEDQVGIYPRVLPGGWNSVGLTPVNFNQGPSRSYILQPGDFVSFVPISEAEYLDHQGREESEAH